jgi:hypothetical protein
MVTLPQVLWWNIMEAEVAKELLWLMAGRKQRKR